MSSNETTPPRPKGRDRRAKTPFGRPSSSLWYGVAFLLLLVIAQVYYLAPAGRLMPYSEFKGLLKSGAIEELMIGEQLLRGTLKQPAANDPKASKQFTTTRVEDPKLTEELEAQGVKYSGEAVNRWLPELLGWIIPLVFFVA